MIKIIYGEELPVYPKERLRRCAGSEKNLNFAEWKRYEERVDYYALEPTFIDVEWLTKQQFGHRSVAVLVLTRIQAYQTTYLLFACVESCCNESTATSVWLERAPARRDYSALPNRLTLQTRISNRLYHKIHVSVQPSSIQMRSATAVSGSPQNVREFKRAARKVKPKQADAPPLKKIARTPAKPARKKTEAKLLQVSITVGIVGEDISQATFADMKRFVDSRATVGLIALERGDATLQLHIQGVLALLSTSTKAIKEDILKAIGWKNDCPLGGTICVKALTNKGVHTLVGMVGYCTKDEQELHYEMYSVNVTAQQMEEGKRRYLIFGACNYKNRVELTPYNLLSRAMQYRRYRAKNPLSITFRGYLRQMMLTGQYYPGLRWLLSPKMSYERAESMWRLATAPESTTLRDIDHTFYGLQPTERYHTFNFNESMLAHVQEQAQTREAEDIERQLQELEERIRGTKVSDDPDENDNDDPEPDEHETAEWQDLGDYVPR
ncbi:hypothetical protein R1sor_024945 [Riccia sorocarpa]|uniref:Replitron HUH endonuclease domain-containing protein n=1 Tax=Riccia sorocarpa TaxID=122646 RepID=A0ABD3G8Q0_9MARC